MMKLPYFEICSTESPPWLEADVQKNACVSLRSLSCEAVFGPCQRGTGRPVIGERSVGFVFWQGLNLGGTAVCFGISSHVVWGRGVIFLPFPEKASFK